MQSAYDSLDSIPNIITRPKIQIYRESFHLFFIADLNEVVEVVKAA